MHIKRLMETSLQNIKQYVEMFAGNVCILVLLRLWLNNFFLYTDFAQTLAK